MGLVDIFVVLIFIIFLAFIGLYKSKTKVFESSYLVADRNTNLFSLIATLVMTEFNSATLIAFSSLGYIMGKKAFLFPLIFLIGLLFYAIIAAKKWKEFNGLSVAGFFTKKYGKNLGKIASFLLIVSMIGFTSSYVKSLTLLFSEIFPHLNFWILSLGLVFIILLMCLREGLVSIIRTDILSFILILFIFPLILFFAFKAPMQVDVNIDYSDSFFSFRFWLSLVILTMFTYILAPWYGQKIFSAKNEKTASLAVIFSSVFVFIFYSFAVFTTYILKEKGFILLNPEKAYPIALNIFLPIGLKGLSFALLFATSATTLTGVYSAMSAMVISDFLKEKKSALQSKALMIAFAFLSYILSNVLIDKVFDKMILANIPIAALSFALIGGFYWSKTSIIGAYISTIIGIIAGVVSYLIYKEEGIYTWVWATKGILLIFVSGILGSIAFPDKKKVIQKLNEKELS
ncbi:MAG: hypothetical protein K1060chlam3_00468 [Candidatus Anoxychlamydiales bacterium]|nr:hypothetical protein [Candidatus Anoxychlamydiales bacterium]